MIAKQEIKEKLEEEIKKIQQISGREEPTFFNTLRPIGDIKDFDSLNAVEVATSLSKTLKCKIGIECFYSYEEKRAYSCEEIVDHIYKKADNRKGV